MSASRNDILKAISPGQVRAARALIDWTREQLAHASAVPLRTLARLEQGEGSPQRRTLDAIRAALEAAGVEFIAENGGGPGVRLKPNAPKLLSPQMVVRSGGVEIQAQISGQTCVVIITIQAIRGVVAGPKKLLPIENLLSVHRERFLDVAERKIAAQRFEADGTIYVTLADLEEFPSPSSSAEL